MISSLTFMPNFGVPLSTHFSGPEVMTSQPEVTTFWGRLGSFGDKISSLKKMGCSNAFPVPDGTLGSLLHLYHVLDYVLSIFHFYEVVNCKP